MPMDRQVKNAILKWAKATEIFGKTPDKRPWVRCQPVSRPGVTHPRLRPIGSTLFATQPDGLYALFSSDGSYVDLMAIEACGTFQNLFDKQSRYSAGRSNMLLDVPLRWLDSVCYTSKKWWQLTRSFEHLPEENLLLPIRYLRAIYILPNDKYELWIANASPVGHEYFIPLSSVNNITQREFREFLGGMALSSHFYTDKINYLNRRGGAEFAHAVEEGVAELP